MPLLLDAGFGVLSEESGLHHGDRDVIVVVDPVDGSTNAARGIPFSACSMCAVDRDGPWVSTVVDLVRGVTYRAVRGGGATRDGVPIRVAMPVGLGDAVVGVNGWSSIPPPCAQIRSLGSAALELALVADGSLDAFVNLDLDGHGAWDYLGAMLIVEEAGGSVGEMTGRELVTLGHADRREIVAASSPELRGEIVAAWAVRT